MLTQRVMNLLIGHLLFVILSVSNLVNVVYAQNQAPRFDPPLQSNYFFHEFNKTKPGDTLLWLNATDYDDDDLKFGIETDFYKKLISIKKVDGKHAIVVANQMFDREVQEKYDNIVFYVQDKPGNRVHQSVRFVILDVDDNPPVFKSTPYRISVRENQPVNTVIFNGIEAHDIDGPIYNRFKFALSDNEQKSSAESSKLFRLDRTNLVSSGTYNTSVILTGQLDYETAKSHVVTIIAISENSLHKSFSELVVNVIDEPDRLPEFSQSPYYVKIEEEMPVDAFVLRVFAKDGDTGINNPCKYEIIPDLNGISEYFEIDEFVGNVFIKKRIDLESQEISRLGGLLEFRVAAYEIGDERSMQTTSVTVAISDINDNKPKFDKKSYKLVISPKAAVGTTLTLVDESTDAIRVFDLDKGINGSFSLVLVRIVKVDKSSILYENDSDFEVVPKIGLNDANVIIKLRNSTNMQKKIGSVEHYHLFAKDNGVNGESTHVDLFIEIETVNQHAPKFERDTYVFYVNENAPLNTTVNHIKASDHDLFGEYGQIRYELKNGQERFEIDKHTGRIYTISTKPHKQLDRELVDTYYLSVEAIDGGGLRTSVQVIIKLNDVNDNRPQFFHNLLEKMTDKESNSNSILIGYIQENTQQWIQPIRLQATDRDVGQNAAIKYEIVDGDFLVDYFDIDMNTIVLKANLTLDFEELYQLKQENKHQAERIAPSSSLSSMINPGEIDLNLLIRVKDQGSPSLSSDIVAKIIVKDENDNKPQFESIFYSTKILETARFGDIFQVTAFDLDAPNTLNSKVNYRIESGAREKFTIDANTGMVKLDDDTNLDKDVYGSFYTLKIVADDLASINNNQLTSIKSIRNNATNSTENVCFLMIEIQDVNNKKPQFVSNTKTISVSEGVAEYTSLTRMEASDPDSDSDLLYFLIKNNTDSNEKFEAFDEFQRSVDVDLVKDWFSIDPRNGTIFTSSPIDHEVAEQVNLIVGVEDLNAADGFKPQIKTTVLKIKILDENDNFPVFLGLKQVNTRRSELDSPIYELFESVEENTRLNTKLTQLKAIDKDKNRKITYDIVQSSAGSQAIALNKTTGYLFINGSIDYETTKWINLTIMASDNGEPIRKHSLLHFYCKIEDTNDNQPEFVQFNTTEFQVYENMAKHTAIAEFTALDADSGLFGTINYKILSGDEGKFYIDSSNGTLYLNSTLDREEQDLYTLVIQAKDNPTSVQQLSDSLMIKIRVLDENDNEPRCEKDYYSIETVQNVDINSTLLQVKGVDVDLNAQLRYSLKPIDSTKDKELFKINSETGLIKINKALNGHAGEHLFDLIITDYGKSKSSHKSIQVGKCSVRIFVKDFNSKPPKFIYPNYSNSTIRIKGTLSFGAEILTVKAEDEDSGINGEVFFYLDENRNDWKSFSLDPKTGLLTLNTKLNINKQSIYSIDIIASDLGKPTQLQSRLTLTLILVDDSNNAAQFNRMQICLSSHTFQCEKDYQSVIIRMHEEDAKSAVSLRLAKMNDLSKSDEDICYYLSGADRDYFTLDKRSALLTPKKRLDREKQDEYELIVKASEYCSCKTWDELNEEFKTPQDVRKYLQNQPKQCKLMNLDDETFNLNDISQLKVKVFLQDVNDNSPKFAKSFYQVGITVDVDYGETILDSFAVDLDVTSKLSFGIIESTFERNTKDDTIPFKLDYKNMTTSMALSQEDRQFRFGLKTQKYFKEHQANSKQNAYFVFKINAFDEDNRDDVATVQVILISKQQRVKLVFSKTLDEVLNFQDEFQVYLSNLTGYQAYIDRINVHRNDDDDDDDEENEQSLAEHNLTDMLLHFVNLSRSLDESNNDDNDQGYVINADKILNILDRSKDINLLRKYKLSLAEKYDDHGTSTFYKYGSAVDEEFGSFFLWQPEIKTQSTFMIRLLLTLLCVILIIFLIFISIICCCMKRKYQRKLKAERAMVKAFGLEQHSLTYSGYINSAFDSNSLLPIPGTNLYAYEGSNPIWLKKYDKIEAKTDHQSSSSSTASTSSSANYDSKLKSNSMTLKNHDLSSFYLKQLDSSPSNHTEKSKNQNNLTLTSELISIHDISPKQSNEHQQKLQKSSEGFNMMSSEYKTDTLLTFASSKPSSTIVSSFESSIVKQQKLNQPSDEVHSANSHSRQGSNINSCANGSHQQPTIIFNTKNSNFKKIVENFNQMSSGSGNINPNATNTTQNQTEQTTTAYNQLPVNANKDYSDLFAVESTVI